MSSFPETQLLQQLEEHRFNEPGRILPELHGKVVSCRCEGSWTRGFIISNLYFFHIVSWTFFCCILVLCAFGVCVWGWSLKKARLSFNSWNRIPGVPMQYEEACERVYGEPYADWKKKNQKKASSSAWKFCWAPHSSDPVVFFYHFQSTDW